VSAWPHGDPREVSQRILADPRYGGDTASAHQKTWLEILFGWLRDILGSLFRDIAHALGVDARFGGVLAVALIAATLAALLFFLVQLARGTRGRRRPDGAATTPLAVVQTSAALYAAALEAAERERWRDAAALLFGAALRALDERGRLPFAPARTAGEARRAVRDRTFDEFAREATLALFARDGATGPRFERMRAAYAGFFGLPA
jgi:hypothetical protein